MAKIMSSDSFQYFDINKLWIAANHSVVDTNVNRDCLDQLA